MYKSIGYKEKQVNARFLSVERRDGERDVQEEVEMYMEAAELAWPNFKTFFSHFRNHLGPDSVEDSSVTPDPSVAREQVVASTVK